MCQMSRFFTKKSVAVILTTIILFGFFNIHSTYAFSLTDIGTGIVNALTAGIATIYSSFLNFIIIPLASFCLAAIGLILDFSIEYSIYGQGFTDMAEPIRSVWVLLRDTANVAFIFVLLYSGIQQIITGSTKKDVLVSIIITATLINFSLFATRIAIDAGNLVATTIYNQIEGTAQSGNASKVLVDKIFKSTSTSSPIDLSGRIISSMKIDSIWDVTGSGQDILVDTFTNGPASIAGVGGMINSSLKFLKILVLFFVFMFLAVIFIGRLVTLILLMATSPIGFIFGNSIPGLSKLASKWRDSLFNAVLIAPVTMFFMLLTIRLSDALPPADNVFISFFNFIFVVYLLVQTIQYVKGLSQFGGLADTIAKSAAGLGLAAATGGTALLARGTLGASAGRLMAGRTGTYLEGLANSNSMLGRAIGKTTTGALNKTATSTFDLRNSKTFGSSVSQLKSLTGADILNPDALKGEGIYGKGKDAKSGYAGMVDRDKKTAEKEGEAIQKRAEAYQQKFVDQEITDKLRNERDDLERQLEREGDPDKQDAIRAKLNVVKSEITKSGKNPEETLEKINKEVDFSDVDSKIEKAQKDYDQVVIDNAKKEENLDKEIIKAQEELAFAEKDKDAAMIKLRREDLEKLNQEKKVVKENAVKLQKDLVSAQMEKSELMQKEREREQIQKRLGGKDVIREVLDAKNRRADFAKDIRSGLTKYRGGDREINEISEASEKVPDKEQAKKDKEMEKQAELNAKAAKKLEDEGK